MLLQTLDCTWQPPVPVSPWSLCLQIRTRILEVQKTGTRYGSGYPDQLAKPEGFADVLREATTTAESVGHTDLALVPADDNRNDISQNNRQLFPFVMIAVITGIVVVGAVAITAIVRVTSPDNPPGIQTLTLDVDSDGSTRLTLTTDTTYLNADQTGLCDGCSIEVEAGACIEGDCVNYDQDATNDNISARVSFPLKRVRSSFSYVRIRTISGCFFLLQ